MFCVVVRSPSDKLLCRITNHEPRTTYVLVAANCPRVLSKRFLARALLSCWPQSFRSGSSCLIRPIELQSSGSARSIVAVCLALGFSSRQQRQATRINRLVVNEMSGVRVSSVSSSHSSARTTTAVVVLPAIFGTIVVLAPGSGFVQGTGVVGAARTSNANSYSTYVVRVSFPYTTKTNVFATF